MPAARNTFSLARRGEDAAIDVWSYGSPITVPVLNQYGRVAGSSSNNKIVIGKQYKIIWSIDDDADNGVSDVRFRICGHDWQDAGPTNNREKVVTAKGTRCELQEARADSASANSVIKIQVIEL